MPLTRIEGADPYTYAGDNVPPQPSQMVPVEPTVSELASIRRAAIEKQTTPLTFGQDNPIGYGLRQSLSFQSGQRASDAMGRLVTSTTEFLKAVGPWTMETLSRPTEDTPLTAALGAALEVAMEQTAPVDEVFHQAIGLVGESLGMAPETIAQLQERGRQASSTIAGAVATLPGFKALEAKLAKQQSPVMKAKAQIFKQAREDLGLTLEDVDRTLDDIQNDRVREFKPPNPEPPTAPERISVAQQMAEELPNVTEEDLQAVERAALEEESALAEAARQTQLEQEAAALGVDPATGEPVQTPAQKRAAARRKEKAAAKPRKTPRTGQRRLTPQQEAFRDTYGGSSIGSSIAKQRREAKKAARAAAKAERTALRAAGLAEQDLTSAESGPPSGAADIAIRPPEASGDLGDVPPTVGRRTPGTADAESSLVSDTRAGKPERSPEGALPGADLDALAESSASIPRGVVDTSAPPSAAAGGTGASGIAEVPRGESTTKTFGESLPIRKVGLGEILHKGDPVTDPTGKKWMIVEQTPEGRVNVERLETELKDGVESVKAYEEASFDRSELSFVERAYDPEKGLPAVKLSDGSVVVGTRYTHNSALVEAKMAGLGDLLVDDPAFVGHVIGPDRKFVNLVEYEKFRAAKEIAFAEADSPQPGGGPAKTTIGEELAKRSIDEGGFIELPGRMDRSEALLKKLQRRSKSALSSHGLKVTEYAAPNALDAINYAVGARGGSHFYVAHKFTIPIDRAIGVGGHERVAAALRDSNVQGAKARWLYYADELKAIDDPTMMERADNYWRDWYNLAVDHLNEERDAQLLKGRLTRAMTEKNAGEVRMLLDRVFRAAGDSIGPMPEESAAFIKSPEFWKGIEAASEFLENLKRWNMEVGGHETQFTGPAQTYFPLTPFDASMEARPFAGGQRVPFRRIRPGTTMHRTGLSRQYDASVEALARRVKSNIVAVGKNRGVDALVESGVGVIIEQGQKPPEFLSAVPGVKEKVRTFQVTPDRTVIGADGKSKLVRGKRLALPESVANELEPIYTAAKMEDAEAIERIQNALVNMFLRGLAEPAIHGQNVVSFLGKATGEFFPQALWRVSRVVMDSPEAIKQLQWMAEHGSLPNRYASVTFSRALAKQFGAEYISPNPFHLSVKESRFPGFPDLSPFLYGPNGIDIKARVAAGIFFDEHFGGMPGILDRDKFRFLEQLGHYQAQTRTAFQKAVTKTAIQPFFTAASSRVRNALEIWGLQENSTPLRGLDLAKWRLRQQVTQGLVGGTMAWVASHYAVTGKFPWEDKNAKLWQVPVPRAWEKSPVARLFWSEDPYKRKYIGIGGLFPVGYTVQRIFGLQHAANVALRGGDIDQILEAGGAQALGATMSQVVGPVLHVLMAMVPEVEPDILRFGRRGSGPLSFAPKEEHGKPSPGLNVGQRLRAASEEVAPFLNQLYDLATDAAIRKTTGPRFAKSAANLILKQLIGGEEDVNATRERLRKERQQSR